MTGFCTYGRERSMAGRPRGAYLDHFEELFGPVHAADGELVQQLDWTQARARTGAVSIIFAAARKMHAGGARRDAPMSPLKRLKVRGMRTWGLTSMRTPLAVWM